MDLKNRLNNIIERDKKTNPQYLINVIKSDFFYLISNYFEVDFDDINVNIETDNGKYVITLSATGERMKIMKSI